MNANIVKKCFFILIVFFISQNAFSKDLYPKDITLFLERRDLCQHFIDEFSGDPKIDNARNLNAELDKYCKGTDQELARLKSKYKDSTSILKKLEIYDEDIEPDSDNNENDRLFEKYSVTSYRGDIKIPSGYIQKDNIWFDHLKKVVNPVVINFSGKYYIGLHSCGYSCRYYTLNDLAENKDYSNELRDFTSNPEANTDNNYFIELLYQPSSYLIIARYYKNIDSEEYQDCYFVFEENKIKELKQEKCPVFL